MSKSFPANPYALIHSPDANQMRIYDHTLQDILSRKQFQKAWDSITQWPGYQPTPLHLLTGIAHASKVEQLYYKDEGPRFGLNSFKGLGGAYAVYRLVEKHLKSHGIASPSVADIFSGNYAKQAQSLTITCATDGNHGRAVAWGAQQFGCKCIIYIHRHVSTGREQAIARFGAEVIRVDGNYDDSVRIAQQEAQAHGRIVVSDTSYPGYTNIPKDVMQGYTVMVEESLQQLPKDTLPTHIFLQCGVGAMAAAVIAHYQESYGEHAPRFIIVEPDKADCFYQSIKSGKITTVSGENGTHDTIMAGLACGEVSQLAWQIITPFTRDYMTITDDTAKDTMRLLAAAPYGDAPLVAGESAVAGLGAFLLIAADDEARSALGISEKSRIMIYGTEADSDPELYQRIVGVTARDVRAGHAMNTASNISMRESA